MASEGDGGPPGSSSDEEDEKQKAQQALDAELEAHLTLAEFSIPLDPAPPVTELASRAPALPEADSAAEEGSEPAAAPHQAPGHGASRPTATGHQLRVLCLSALGVVFGDIGTSPLYALRECFAEGHGVRVTHDNVLGILSLIIWALTVTVSLKYVVYVLRADNRGEGGILALMALSISRGNLPGVAGIALVAMGLFGAALLYGDGMITPAISVLSAVEGLEVVQPGLHTLVMPITVIILVALFAVQKRGTAKVGRLFGPITLVWFATLALLGATHIMDSPEVLWSFDPRHAVHFFLENGVHGFLILGSVLLVATGGEALYADMGHFGTRPIRLVWYGIVLPALVLNYLGQGAFLLDHPRDVERAFFGLAPAWALLPLVLLSTAATIIASQALISGAFSITRQAIMLGYWPRVRVQHTSSHETGQVYVPSINWMLMVSTIVLVLFFGSSSRLAAAYGMAVTTTMVITTIFSYVVAVRVWQWHPAKAALVTLSFLLVDSAFFGATLVKFAHGGWVPVAVAGALFIVMTTWRRGRLLLQRHLEARAIPLADFFDTIRQDQPYRVPGTAVFLTGNPKGTPPALLLNYRHNSVVHRHVILLTIVTEPVSFVDDIDRVRVEHLPHGFSRIVARYGFMENPDVPELLSRRDTPRPLPEETTYFVGREVVHVVNHRGMAKWRKRLFAFMVRNDTRANAFFALPADRVAELGGQVDL